MERGDISPGIGRRVVCVLEGALTRFTYVEEGRFRKRRSLKPADEWAWSQLGLRSMWDLSERRGIPVEVVTFTNDDIAAMAGDYFLRYEVPVAMCSYVHLNQFAQSLYFRPDIEFVMDSDTTRLGLYGQRGYQVVYDRAF